MNDHPGGVASDVTSPASSAVHDKDIITILGYSQVPEVVHGRTQGSEELWFPHVLSMTFPPAPSDDNPAGY